VLVVERVTTRAKEFLHALKTMDIARRNASKNGIDII